MSQNQVIITFRSAKKAGQVERIVLQIKARACGLRHIACALRGHLQSAKITRK